MLKALLLPLLLAPAAMAMAQISLVPNGSFEDTVNCSLSVQSIHKTTHWYNPNIATPDVWDCDSGRWCGMPMTLGDNSYQYSYDGDRHAGIYCWYGYGSSNTREFLGVQLLTPLSSGSLYEVSLRYSRRRVFGLAIDHIGVWFGWDSLWQNTPNWLTVEPQLRVRDPENEYLSEADEWVLIKDTLIATGGEQWMVIGHFEPAATVNGIHYDPIGITLCYYYIDDVVVRSLDDHSGINQSAAFWGGDALVFRGQLGRSLEVRILDPSGRLLQVHSVKGGDRLHLPELPSGIYLVEVIGSDGRSAIKVLKE